MNLDNKRLREIQTFKNFYNERLEEAETELERAMLQIQLSKLDEEEQDILKRCNAL